MTVVDFNGVREARSVHELEGMLMTRHGDSVNSFWLTHGTEDYPKLSLLVKGALATLSYLPKAQDAGFRSVGKLPELSQGGITSFSLSKNPADDVVVLNNAVLPFTVALQVAKEFYSCKDLPQSIDWLQL